MLEGRGREGIGKGREEREERGEKRKRRERRKKEKNEKKVIFYLMVMEKAP